MLLEFAAIGTVVNVHVTTPPMMLGLFPYDRFLEGELLGQPLGYECLWTPHRPAAAAFPTARLPAPPFPALWPVALMAHATSVPLGSFQVERTLPHRATFTDHGGTWYPVAGAQILAGVPLPPPTAQ